MQRLLSLVLVLMTISATATAQESYFPHRDGLTWTYSNGETQTLYGPRSLAGHEVMVLVHYFEGLPVSEDYLVYDPAGVFSLGTAAGGRTLVYNPPLTIYQGERLEPGDTWSSTAQVGDLAISLTAEVIGVRGVQNAAGRFNALLVRQTTVTSTGAQTVLDLFVVPGVGVVRFVTEDGTVVDLLEKNF